jgi:hypothetical protein
MGSVLSRWEEAAGGGAFRSIAGLCGALFMRPVSVFAELTQPSGNVKRRAVRALLFVAILSYLRLGCEALTVKTAGRWLVDKTPDAQAAWAGLEAAFFASPWVLLRPVAVFFVTFGCVAFGVKLLLGIEKPVMPALLIVCYKSAAEALCLIPVIGGVLALVWSLALTAVGLREAYRVSLVRSVMAGIVMPFFLLLFGLLSLGSGVNRGIVLFYPEVREQVIRMNDMTATAYTASIVKAAQDYQKDLGFAPANLGVVKKFLPGSVADDLGAADTAAGYRFELTRSDATHFRLEATPVHPHVTGSLAFSVDETGAVLRTGADTASRVGSKDLEALITQGRRDEVSHETR